MRLAVAAFVLSSVLAMDAGAQTQLPQAKPPEWKADCLCAVAGTNKYMGVFNITAANLDSFRKLLQAGSGDLGTTLTLVGKKCDKPAQCGKTYTDPARALPNAAIDGPRTIKINSAAGLPREGTALKPEKLAAGDQIVLIGDPVR